MPIISQFYGIIIRVYFNDTEKHYLEHIHVQYNEYDAVYSIKEGSVIEGKLPKKQHKLVAAWIEIHKDELKALWEVSQKDGEIFKIDPLK
ncbi:MAG: DUF4160 domain-containing protein [Clostridia bacterium]|nr:DUF4160 domain-containing protein [Clostridia bacterium]